MGASRLKVAQVPEDLILEILYRLPVKSLVRFKSVCKRWNQFLKSRSFITMHQKFNSGRLKSQLLMCSTYETEDKKKPKKKLKKKPVKNHVFSLLSNHKSATVLSPNFRILADPNTFAVCLAANSCNGIVCYFDDHSETIFLSNPATREFRQLPPGTFHQDQIEQTGVAFGYESADIYDFNVLRLFCQVPTRVALGAEIFTLSSNTWKQLHWGLDDDDVKFCSKRGFFFAYSFHFIFNNCGSPARQAIVCCDIHTERFTIMELPSALEGRFASGLMVFREFLSTVVVDDQSVSLWIMEDYGVVESWNKLYSIRLPSYFVRPLLCWTVEDALLIELDDGKLLSCDLNTQTFDSIEIQGFGIFSRLLIHQETLVSIM